MKLDDRVWIKHVVDPFPVADRFLTDGRASGENTNAGGTDAPLPPGDSDERPGWQSSGTVTWATARAAGGMSQSSDAFASRRVIDSATANDAQI